MSNNQLGGNWGFIHASRPNVELSCFGFSVPCSSLDAYFSAESNSMRLQAALTTSAHPRSLSDAYWELDTYA